MKQKYYLSKEGVEEPEEFYLERVGNHLIRITHPNGTEVDIDYRRFGQYISMMTPGSRSLNLHVAIEKDENYRVTAPDETYRFRVLNERKMLMAQAIGGGRSGGGPELICPMAGKVVLVKVSEGDLVEEGDVVVVVEAMKMENDLKAHLSGKISKVVVSPGDTIEIGDVLVEIEPVDGDK